MDKCKLECSAAGVLSYYNYILAAMTLNSIKRTSLPDRKSPCCCCKLNEINVPTLSENFIQPNKSCKGVCIFL